MFTWKVGEGTKIKFWKDRWCSEGEIKNVFARLFNLALDKNISVVSMKQRWQEDHEHLWRRRLRGWETDSEKELGKVIDKICLNLKVDTLELLGNNGHFNSRDMYSKLDHSNQVPGTWHQFWKLRLPSRIKIFI